MAENGSQYPDQNFDVFKTVIKSLDAFNKRFNLYESRKQADSDYPAFSAGVTFFDAAIDAIQSLQGKIKLELLHGELMHELSRMKLEGDSSRPYDFPRRYRRMWLSNVP